MLDDRGRILPEVVRVMELCAEADIIFASGHSSPQESLILARKAKEVGVRKFVVTHVNSLIWKLTRDQIRQAVELGAFVEYCYLPRLWGPGSLNGRVVRSFSTMQPPCRNAVSSLRTSVSRAIRIRSTACAPASANCSTPGCRSGRSTGWYGITRRI